MRVLHIITSLNIGGAEKLIVDSLPFYLEQGLSVDLLMLQESDTLFKKQIEEKFEGKVRALSKGSPYNPFHIFKLRPIIEQYDLVHVHLFPTLYWVVLASFFSQSNVPLVYTEHSTSNRRRKNKLFKICDKWIYSRLSFIGCISEACYINLKTHLNYKKSTIQVINNGIDLKPFKNIDNSVNAFFDPRSFVLIQVSSFRVQKDQKTVIKALALLPDVIKLVLVGEGPLRNECEELVNELQLKERVCFTGNRKDIPNLFKQADLAIQSSNYEGFGLVSVEAMAAGKAVIASDVEGLNDVVRDYGVLFPKGDSETLAKEIESFYNNIAYRERIEQRCKKRAASFDIIFMIKKYIDVYKSVVNEE